MVAGQPCAGEDDVLGLAEGVGHRYYLLLRVGEGSCHTGGMSFCEILGSLFMLMSARCLRFTVNDGLCEC